MSGLPEMGSCAVEVVDAVTDVDAAIDWSEPVMLSRKRTASRAMALDNGSG